MKQSADKFNVGSLESRGDRGGADLRLPLGVWLDKWGRKRIVALSLRD